MILNIEEMKNYESEEEVDEEEEKKSVQPGDVEEKKNAEIGEVLDFFIFIYQGDGLENESEYNIRNVFVT